MTALGWHHADFERLVAAKAALPHALLIRGPRGIGKLLFARALAQALLCESPLAGGAACGSCPACTWLAAASHPDFRQVEPGGDTDEGEEGKEPGKKSKVIGVDQVRALADLVNVSTHRGGPKIVLVHPAEALNVNAANALLKSLEEPPPRTHFLLVTHRPHMLLPTIKSRCRQLALPSPDARTAAAWLAAQGVRNAEVALADTGGAPLLALELGQSEYLGARAAFLRELGRRDLDIVSASEAIRDLPVPLVIAWLQKWSYDIARFQATGEIRYNPDHAEAITRAARDAGRLAVLRFHRDMVKLQPFAQHPLNPRNAIEHLLIAYRDIFAKQPEAA